MAYKNRYEDYTEPEFKTLIIRLFKGDYSSEEELEEIVENIVNISEHPSGSNILYFPEERVEDSPDGVLNAIKQWRAANGKPGFKPETH